MHHTVVCHACEGELSHLRADRGREEQTLTVRRHLLRDGLDLISKAKLEESISLVEDNHLHLRELEACLGDAMHETTRGRNDNIWIEKESFELIFHVVSTDNETVRQVSVLRHLLEVVG